MNAWAHNQGIKNIKMIPDGSGLFTYEMGMLVVKDNLGFGERSWRYAMVVDNMYVEKLFSEPGMSDNCETDPYGETSPEKIIDYLKSAGPPF
jgi:peroxiredoxin